MSNVKLLPLPEAWACTAGTRRPCWVADEMESYARANVEAGTEALRAEVDSWKELQAYTHDTSVRVGDLLEAAEARAERLAESLREIERQMPKDRAGPSWIARTIAAEALHPTAAQENDHA